MYRKPHEVREGERKWVKGEREKVMKKLREERDVCTSMCTCS